MRATETLLSPHHRREDRGKENGIEEEKDLRNGPQLGSPQIMVTGGT